MKISFAYLYKYFLTLGKIDFPKKDEKRIMKNNFVLSQEYADCRDAVSRVPEIFEKNEGTVLFLGRNEIRSFCTENGRLLVAKRFSKLGFIRSIIYTFFRSSKAKRAYRNAQLLRQLGFDTPREVAYIECAEKGMLSVAYLVTEFTALPPISDCLNEAEVDEPLLTDFAGFVARMHKNGILYRDLNSTNALYERTTDGFRFELIDANRMKIFPTELPEKESLQDIAHFSPINDSFRFFLRKYIYFRGWDSSVYEKGIAAKKRFETHRRHIKSFTRLFKKKK